MKIVILAEKPAQAMDYGKALGIKQKHDGYIELKDSDIIQNAIVTWAFGHLVELKLPKEYKEPVNTFDLNNLPYFPKPIEYKVTKDKVKQFKIVRDLMNKADVLINATDYGREGSNIFYSIAKLSGIKDKKILRYGSGSQAPNEVRKHFRDLHDNSKDLKMYNEANARQISDYLIGMNLSPLYTKLFNKKGVNQVFSIGRVQTPTLFLVYKRQQEIDNFKPTNFYELTGEFKANNGIYKGKAKVKTEDKEEINKLCKQHQLGENVKGTVVKYNTEEKTTKSPNLYSLSTLQMDANTTFKYSIADTLKIVQSLYDKKILTYPRTDTDVITHSEYDYLLNNIEKLKQVYNKDFETYYKEPRKKYVVDEVEEHHAIVPTSLIPEISTIQKLTDKEKNILDLVVTRTLSMFAPDYVYDETNIETSVNDLMFYTKGTTEKSKGWKALINRKPQKEKQEDDEHQQLPILEIDERVDAKTNIKESTTKPPTLLTEKQLLMLMKTCGKTVDDEESKSILKDIQGIGTSATRAETIETLKRKEYIELKKNKIHITPKGEMLCTAVKGSLLSSPEMTAEWEKKLKLVGKGEYSPNKFIEVTMKFIEKELSSIGEKEQNASISKIANTIKEESNIGKCPNCTNGDIVKRGKVYKCTDCEQVFFSNFFKKKLSENQIKEIITNGKTKKKLKLPKKDGSTYEAFLCLENDDSRNMKKYGVSFK
ncbi:DNA topoisomerase [Mammaliicoccus sciuri]|uniref:DNA topoisomerase n=1 Tax=Mammaliicoccus sciuri TaxID=1296 RepID=UPI0027378707|nr:DNA topoisomerase [Mammaliicoccus sciuri]